MSSKQITQNFLDWHKDNQSTLESLQERELRNHILELADQVGAKNVKSPLHIVFDHKFHPINTDQNISYSAWFDEDNFIRATINTFKKGGKTERFNGREVCWEEYQREKENYQPVKTTTSVKSSTTKVKLKSQYESYDPNNDENRKAEKLAKKLFQYRYQTNSEGKSTYLESKRGADLAHHIQGIRYGTYNNGYARKEIPCIIVPILDIHLDGTIHAIQFLLDEKIGNNNKINYGSYQGKFALIGEVDPKTLYVCEGIATGLSIFAAMGKGVFCALSGSNLKSVAINLREKYPDAEIILCADDESLKENYDQKTNLGYDPPGIKKAKESLKAITGAAKIYAPSAPPPYQGSDFNDLHQQCGIDAVKYCLTNAPISSKKPIEPFSWITNKRSLNNDQNAILDLLRSSEKHLYIHAETGSGKTYAAALYFLECLNQKKHVIFFAGTLATSDEFYNTLQKIAGRDLKDEVQKVFGHHNKSMPEGKIMGLIMISTYLTRRGISSFLRQPISLIRWTDEKKPIVLIDEIDQVIQGNVYHIPLSARYKTELRKGAKEPIHSKMPKCPASNRSGNCKNCHLVKNRTVIQVDEYSIPTLITPKEFHEQDSLSTEVLPEFRRKPIGKVGYLLVHEIEQNFNRQAPIWTQLDEGKIFHAREGLESLVNWSYNPMIYHAFPRMPNDHFIDQEEILESMAAEDNPMETAQSPNLSKIAKYPPIACDCEILTGIDLMPFTYIERHANKVRFLTATTTEEHLEALKAVYQNLAHYQIKGDQRKIEEVLLIGVKKNLHTAQIKTDRLESWEKHGEVLIFASDKSDAEKIYKPLENHPSAAILRGGDYYQNAEWSRHNQGGKTKGEIKTRIAYQGSIIHRAVNFGEAKLIIIDTQSYKPLIAYHLTDDSEIDAVRDISRQTNVIQAIGRVLRKEEGEELAKRVMILHGVEDEKDLHRFAQQIQNRIENLSVALYQKPDNAYNDGYHWYLTGEYTNTEPPIGKKRSSLSRKARALIDYEQPPEARKEERTQTAKERALAKLEEYRQQRVNWTKANKFCNLKLYHSEKELQKIRRKYNINN